MCFAALLAYSGWQAWGIYGDYKEEADMHGLVLEYKPKPSENEFVNQSVLDLRVKYPDAVGWLTVPGTKIDYPFVALPRHWHRGWRQDCDAFHLRL